VFYSRNAVIIIVMKKVSSVEEVRSIVKPILKKHGIRKAGFFGSFARGESGKDSDIDLLVEIGSDISLLDFVGIKQELEEALGRKVDLVEYKVIKPRIRARVLREEVSLF